MAHARLMLVLLTAGCDAKTSTPAAEDAPAPTAPPKTASAPVVEAPPSTESETPRPPEAKAPTLIFDQEDADATRLAEHFCSNGHGWFGPPSGKPYPKWDDWDYQPGDPLSSCEQVQADTLTTFKAESASATITRLEVVVENADGDGPGLVAVKEVVTVRTKAGVTDHTLSAYPVSDFEEASEGSTALSFEGAQFRDILGGPLPDLVFERTSSTDGNFEADRCYNVTSETTSLVVCGDHLTHPGCIEIPVDAKWTTRPWSDLSECDDDELEKGKQVAGFVVTYEIPKKDVLVAKLTRKRTREGLFGEAPPVVGTVSLDELFASEDLRLWSSDE